MELQSSDRYYSFGPYVLDRLRGILWHDGVHVPLTPRVFDILVALVQHPGQLLTKDEFMRLVWAGQAVEDNNLARHVSTLRKVLHERPGQREYIATVPGSGYRFVATVRVLDALPSEIASSPSETTMGPREEEHRNPEPARHAPAAGSVALSASRPEARLHADVVPAPAITRPGRWPALVVAAVGIVAVAALAYRFAPGTASSAPVQRSLWQFTHESGSQHDPAWSPDGSSLAFSSDAAGNPDIWVRALDESEAHRLTLSDAAERQPAWSPDGSWIAYRSDGPALGLYVIPAAGGPSRLVSPFGSSPRWSRDSRLILFAGAELDTAAALKLFIVGLDGKPPRQVSHPALAGLRIVAAQWAPDGRISFWGMDSSSLEHRFVTVPLDNGPAVASALPEDVSLAASGLDLSSFVWAPTGRYLYFEGRSQSVRNVWRIAVDPRTLAWVGAPERLTVGPGANTGISVSADGSKLAFGAGNTHVGLWNFPFDPASGLLRGDGEPITPGEPGERSGSVTGDGARVAYRFTRNGRQEIWERTRRSAPRLLVSETDWSQSEPRWSRDGSKLAYRRRPLEGRSPGGGQALVILDVSSGERRLIPVPSSQTMLPMDWTADGNTLLGGCRLSPADLIGTCLWSLAPAPGQPSMRRLSHDPRANQFQQQLSPNQRWISFISSPPGDRTVTQIMLLPATGGVPIPVTDGTSYDDKPRWAPDGRTLYYVSNKDGRCEVWGARIDPATGRPDGAPIRVTRFAGSGRVLALAGGAMDISVTPTGLVLPMHDDAGRVWILDQVDQ